jgi:hypothetical protein
LVQRRVEQRHGGGTVGAAAGRIEQQPKRTALQRTAARTKEVGGNREQRVLRGHTAGVGRGREHFFVVVASAGLLAVKIAHRTGAVVDHAVESDHMIAAVSRGWATGVGDYIDVDLVVEGVARKRSVDGRRGERRRACRAARGRYRA